MNSDSLNAEYKFLKKTISSLNEQIDLFETIQALSQKIISLFDIEKIYETLFYIIKEVVKFKFASIYLYKNQDQFTLTYSQGLEENKIEEYLPEKSVIDWVMEQGRWTVLTDIHDNQSKYASSILPIGGRDKRTGFMLIVTEHDQTIYNKKLASVLSFVASQTAIAIENQNLYSDVKDSRVFLSNIVESINNGILVTDVNGIVTLLNKNTTAILGIKSKKIIGSKYNTFLEGKLKKEIGKIYKGIIKNGFAIESIISHLPYEEVEVLIGITASLLTNKARETIGVIFIFRNLSATKEIARLTRLDEMKNEFVSNVSHELRTPLSIIKSYSEALLNQVEPDDHDTRNQFLSVIDKETDNLTNMVGNLLDLSRIEMEQYELNFDQISLSEIINSILTSFQKKLTRFQVHCHLQENTPNVWADEHRIREVIINLIANSIKFSPEGGIININMSQDNNNVNISISDTGIGIPKKELDNIFKKFYRVDNSDTYEIEGTGLGLSIVKHIINAHKGKIWVESKFGKGSTFSISIPIERQ